MAWVGQLELFFLSMAEHLGIRKPFRGLRFGLGGTIGSAVVSKKCLWSPGGWRTIGEPFYSLLWGVSWLLAGCWLVVACWLPLVSAPNIGLAPLKTDIRL